MQLFDVIKILQEEVLQLVIHLIIIICSAWHYVVQESLLAILKKHVEFSLQDVGRSGGA